MSGGSVSDNTATTGGGVYVSYGGTFNMSGGAVISGNTASANGGGVYVSYGGTFNKFGGTIYGDDNTIHTTGSDENTAGSGDGHAAYVFTGSKKRNSTAGPGVNLDGAYSGPIPGGGWE
jgi:hypothetical protein